VGQLAASTVLVVRSFTRCPLRGRGDLLQRFAPAVCLAGVAGRGSMTLEATGPSEKNFQPHFLPHQEVSRRSRSMPTPEQQESNPAANLLPIACHQEKKDSRPVAVSPFASTSARAGTRTRMGVAHWILNPVLYLSPWCC
jgi:hypothetical protein